MPTLKFLSKNVTDSGPSQRTLKSCLNQFNFTVDSVTSMFKSFLQRVWHRKYSSERNNWDFLERGVKRIYFKITNDNKVILKKYVARVWKNEKNVCITYVIKS